MCPPPVGDAYKAPPAEPSLRCCIVRDRRGQFGCTNKEPGLRGEYRLCQRQQAQQANGKAPTSDINGFQEICILIEREYLTGLRGVYLIAVQYLRNSR